MSNEPTAKQDPVFVEFRRLVDEYKALATVQCNPSQTDSPRVLRWIAGQLALIAQLEEREAAGLPVPHPTATVKLMTGVSGHTLLRRAPWLDDPARDALTKLTAFPALLHRGKYRFTMDFGTHHQARWKQDLAAIVGAPDLRAIEIGVFEGMTTGWLLDNVLTHESSRLICVDAFEPPRPDANYAFDRRPDDPAPEQLFDQNVKAAAGAHKITKLKGYSQLILRTLPVESFDYIYVDGSHTAPDVLEDAVLAWRLLREGGTVCFDDYGWTLPTNPLERPAPAIDAFMSIFAGRFEIVSKAWQITLRKLKS